MTSGMSSINKLGTSILGLLFGLTSIVGPAAAGARSGRSEWVRRSRDFSVQTQSLPAGQSQVPYSATLTARGGLGPYTWSIGSGALPAGLSLNSSTGVVSGTPSTSGKSAFEIVVTDSSAPAQTAHASLALRIAAASQSSVTPTASQPLVILTSALPAGTAGSNYSSSLQTSGGAPPYNWAVNSGVLPAGLHLASSTGLISGAPTAPGTSSLLMEVTDSASNTATQELSISITAALAPSKPLQISSSALPSGMAGSAYSDSLQATGGVSPYSWLLISGVLPTGLNLSSPTGTISGIPTSSGTASFSVQVTDSARNTATQALNLSIAAAPVTTPVPPPSANTLTTSDSLLNTGSPISVSYNAPGTDAKVGVVKSVSNTNNQLWELVVSPWNVNAGSGTIKMSYSGSGSITTQVNLTGLDNQAVNGYPFIFYGGDQWGDQIGGQPPQFPAQLSAMSSLVADASYSLTGTFGGDIDVLYDEWLIPSKTYTGGSGGALEVEVLPYCQFADFGGYTLVKTFSQTGTINGVQTSMNFDEYSTGKGGGNAILFIPVNGVISGEVRLDLLAFMNEGATTAGLDSSWWLSGIELGTEFGDGSTENFTFTVTKLDIEQTAASTGN